MCRFTVQATKAQAALRVTGAQPPLPLSAYAGTFSDSLYGPVNVTLKGGQLELERGQWRGPLEFWNANNFRWTTPPASPTGPLNIKFEISPDNVVTGLYFGLGNEATLLTRASGSRGGRGGAP